MISGRAKGMAGEHEFCEWLYTKGLTLTMPRRNIEQVRSGGLDVAPEQHPFVYEVKRVENVTDKTLDGWWHKAMVDARRYPEREPVVAYRRNRSDWSFLVSVERLLGVKGGYAIIKAPTFIRYAQKRIASHYESD